LPEDPATLKALLLAALTERDREQQRADELYVQTLRLQLELERYKKCTTGRAPTGCERRASWRKRC